MSALDMIPPDVRSIILSFLTFHEIEARMTQLSKKWYNTVKHDENQFWRRILIIWSKFSLKASINPREISLLE